MNEIDNSAVGAIAELAKASMRTQAMQVEGMPHRVMIVAPDGKYEWYDKPPADIAHCVDSVRDMIRAAAAEGNGGSLWVSPNRITYIIEPDDRRDRIDCLLARSAHFEILSKLQNRTTWMSQKEMLWMLQSDLDGCVSTDSVAALRYLRFSRISEGHSTVTHGGDSLGRAVAAECKASNGEIPEYLPVTIRLFATPGLTLQEPCRINCRLMIDTDDQKMCLVPLPDELDKATRRVLAAEVEVLTGDGEGDGQIPCPVYLGTPG